MVGGVLFVVLFKAFRRHGASRFLPAIIAYLERHRRKGFCQMRIKTSGSGPIHVCQHQYSQNGGKKGIAKLLPS